MFRRLVPFILLVLATQVLASTAEADRPPPAKRAAFLDPSFGESGRTMLPLVDRPEGELAAALMPDDGLVVGTGGALNRLGPDGRLDQSFGQGGTVVPPAPSDGGFRIEGVAVDSQGRLIVAGTGVHPVAQVPFGSGAAGTPTSARIMRYLPSGALDPGFGDGGVVETDLGLPPPRDEDGAQILAEPWVEVSAVTVDSQDRIVLTGGASAGLRGNCAHDWYWDTLTYAAFVARLTPAGALDPGFGQAGVFGGRDAGENPLRAEAAADPEVGPGDGVTFSSSGKQCPRSPGWSGLARLDAGGRSEAGFGVGGAIRSGGSDLLVLPDGGIATIGYETPWYYGEEAARVGVSRYTPGGALDRGFGTRGKAVVRTPGGAGGVLTSLAADSGGRLLLAGTMTAVRRHRAGGKGKARRQRLFVLMRLNAGGRLDRAFGPGGRVAARFGIRNATASQILLDSRGRAVLIGTYGPYDHPGVAVARYAITR
jgi:uncharacterized delta-60 repeat protein